MSYQERRAIVTLITTVLMVVFFFVYLLPRYPSGDAYSPDIFHFWGSVVVILIPVSIALNIAVGIAFSIAYSMATLEKESRRSDERDNLIALRSLRNSMYVFTAGFFLAMLSLVFNMPPTVMFIILMIFGYGSGMVAVLSQIYFYRRGF